MDSAIVDNFALLSNENDSIRLDGELKLIKNLSAQYCSKQNNENKEWNYAMRRLIRGLGSSRMSSRKGFYTSLMVLMTTCRDMTIEDLIPVIEAELSPANSNSKSENAEIHMGRLLFCGASIRSKLILDSPVNIQDKILDYLLTSGKQRNYLSFVSVSFLVEFIQELDLKTLEETIWSRIEKELGKPWSEQTVDTLYVLLILRNKFPSLVGREFCKKYLDCQDLIDCESMENLFRVLTNLPRSNMYRHPVFNVLCQQLTNLESIIKFWNLMDEKFVKPPSKTNEYLAIEIFQLIVSNSEDKSILPLLISPNFLRYTLKKFSTRHRDNQDPILMNLKNSFNSFISATCGTDVKTKTQIAVIKKLIYHPGDLSIEKISGMKLIQNITSNLKEDGVKKLSIIYKNIIENKKTKTNERWTNAERTYACQLFTRLIGLSKVMDDSEWRLDQLKFLFAQGFCRVENVGVELALQFKSSFYRAVDHKFPDLDHLRRVYGILVDYLNTQLKEEKLELRTSLSNEAQETWTKVLNLIERLNKTKENRQAVPIFHTMILHMGLQLFSDPDMAIKSINELESCYQRLTKTCQSENKEDEPEWVEVIVDLILSFLSINSHLLRSLVNCVFPHICQFLTCDAIYQILAVLDVDNDEEGLLGSDSESEDDNDNDNNDNDNNDTENDSNSNEDDKESLSSDKDSDEHMMDQLRSAVSEALGGASFPTEDVDIDVDEIEESEGKKLDDSLAAAFKMFKLNRKQPRSKKQDKSAQALTHFRVRVMDLLDTWLDSGPSLAVVLDTLVPLMALLEFCIKDQHQKPLENRVRGCLKKLSIIKKLKDTDNVDEKLVEAVFKVLIEKGERSASVCQEMGDKLSECCTFLIKCSQQANIDDRGLIEILKTHLIEFFKKRDCILPPSLFKNVFQLCWNGNWELAPLLVEFAFDDTIRSFRRGQALEFLTIFYKNGRLVRSDSKNLETQLEMEKLVFDKTVEILEKDESIVDGRDDNNTRPKEIKQKFTCLLLNLLYYVHGVDRSSNVWDWKRVAQLIADHRSRVSFSKDSKSAYNKLAVLIGAPIRTTTVEKRENLEKEVETDDDEGEESVTKKKKRKRKQKDKQLLKKESKRLRTNVMSEGLEPIKFSSIVLNDEEDEVEIEMKNDF